jgi:hypothetical protein
MEIRGLDFLLGCGAGAVVGVGVTMALFRLRGWFGVSEARRLARENQELQRRLAEKDRHVARMLTETQLLAEKLAQLKKAVPQDE